MRFLRAAVAARAVADASSAPQNAMPDAVEDIAELLTFNVDQTDRYRVVVIADGYCTQSGGPTTAASPVPNHR